MKNLFERANAPKRLAATFQEDADVVLLAGDSTKTLRGIPDGAAKMIITSPPYNIGAGFFSVRVP